MKQSEKASARTAPPRRAVRSTVAPMVLQPRDVALLCDLYAYGSMLRGQIQTLHFGSVQRANARLLLLYSNGFVKRADLPIPTGIGAPAGCQFAYLLGTAGRPVVAGEMGIDPAAIARQERRGTPGYLLHTIEIGNFRLAVNTALATSADVTLLQFLPERLCQHRYTYRRSTDDGPTRRSEVYKPDAVLLLVVRGEPAGYSVEIDLGHTSSREFLSKIQIHSRYAAAPELFEKRYGMKKRFMLVVTTGQARRDNLTALARRVASPLVRVTTFSAIAAYGVFGPIWHGVEETGPASLF